MPTIIFSLFFLLGGWVRFLFIRFFGFLVLRTRARTHARRSCPKKTGIVPPYTLPWTTSLGWAPRGSLRQAGAKLLVGRQGVNPPWGHALRSTPEERRPADCLAAGPTRDSWSMIEHCAAHTHAPGGRGDVICLRLTIGTVRRRRLPLPPS